MYVKLESASELSSRVDRKVRLVGRISETPWQHLIGNPEGYGHSYYFDVAANQIVIYAKEEITCAGGLVVRGTVRKVQGSSQEPGSKADESYVEYHLTVDNWECLNDPETTGAAR